MDPVRFGILSTAAIGVHKVIPAIQRAEGCEVVAIASRDLSRAHNAAAELVIPTAYGSYDELLTDPDVDAVYNPLPNDLHRPWTLRAAEAGKHVLCEKPLGLDADEAQQMVDGCAAAGVKLAEAFMYRHHVSWQEAVRRVRDGEIGELLAVQSFFSYYNVNPSDIRNQSAHGGGGLLDIGCYCIHLSRLLFDAEPEQVLGAVRRHPESGVDVVSSGLLVFPGGGQATFTCSTRSEPDQRVHIIGSRGRIEIEIPFNIPTDRPTRIRVTAGGDPPVAPDTTVVELPTQDVYAAQAEVFARWVRDEGPAPAAAGDAVANLRVIDAIFDAADRPAG